MVSTQPEEPVKKGGENTKVADDLTTSAPLEADEGQADEGYEGSTSSTFVTSIASNIRTGVRENGRMYAAYGQHKSWVPVDDHEMDRNDLQHCKFNLLMNGKYHLAPIVEDPQKILDLGTGSGIWAIDIADKHPSARVVGIDTAAVQPSVIPPNVEFEIEDIENDWLYNPESFDFIHGRELLMAIRDWPKLIQQSFKALKPEGYLELASSVPLYKSDDGTIPPNCAYVEVANIYFEMADKIGASGKDPIQWKQNLGKAGFVDVVETVLRIPTNPWPKDPRMKKIGAFEICQFRDGVNNIFSRAYTQILGGDPAYLEVLLAKATQQMMDRKIHGWVPFYVVYGRKP